MKQTFGLGLFVVCLIFGTKGVWGRPLGSEELREERLAILRRIIEDMRELIVSKLAFLIFDRSSVLAFHLGTW